MTGTTVEGRQAYAILSWANDNPADRVAEATARVRALASGLPQGTPAMREVQDVGTVIARLASALRSPVGLSGGGIAAQVIELRYNPAQPRDPHTGKWVKGGGLISDAVKESAPDLAGRPRARSTASAPHTRAKLALARQARVLAQGGRVSSANARQIRGAGPASDIERISQNIRHQVAVPLVDTRKNVSQAELNALADRLNAQIQKAEKQSKELEQEQRDERRAELGVEILAIAAGGALAFFGSHLGLGGGGEGAAAAVALGPFLVKTAIEKIPDIARALANFSVVGKGIGRSWIAHPVRKPVQVAATGARVVAKKAVAPVARSTSRKVRTISSQVAVAASRRKTPPLQPSGT